MYYLTPSFRLCVCEGTARNEAVFRPRSLDVDCRLHHRFPEVRWKVSQNFHK